MHHKDIRTAGSNLKEARSALIMIHGRGARAEDILELATRFSTKECAVIAPQATNHTWYPYSFLAPRRQNEPWLSSALQLLDEIVGDLHAAHIPSENIYFAGFSQGACLTLEYIARRARRWGGVAAFTGGLIGDRIDDKDYAGDLLRTPIFIGTSDPDPHVPPARVKETTRILEGMNGEVMEKIYPGIGHTIVEEEFSLADEWVFRER